MIKPTKANTIGAFDMAPSVSEADEILARTEYSEVNSELSITV